MSLDSQPPSIPWSSFCWRPEVTGREVDSSCCSSRLLAVAIGPLNRVALPGVAPYPPLWVWCPHGGGPLSSPLPASKAALSRVQTELSCLCLQIVMSLGGNPRESQAAPIPILGPVNPPVPDAFEAPAGDLCRLKQSSRREGRWLSR